MVGFTRDRRKQREIVHGEAERHLGPNLRFAARGAVTRRPRAVWVGENDAFERFALTSARKHLVKRARSCDDVGGLRLRACNRQCRWTRQDAFEHVK